MYWQVMKMTKVYRGYTDLDWFDDILENGCDSVVWFFETLIEDAESKDLSIQSYIIQYVESGFMKSNIIKNLKQLNLPQPQYIHKFPFLSKEAIEWLEWEAINNVPQKVYGKASKPYVDKWLGQPEPYKPKSLKGKSEYFKAVRMASRQYWLEKAISMGV